MGLANDKTGNTELAVWKKGVAITEWQVATEKLDNLHDIHFGICSNNFDKYVADTSLKGWGPRILDISKRGGRTAEDSWDLLKHKIGKTGAEDEVNLQALKDGKKIASPGFADFFEKFGGDQPIKPGKDVYPKGAMISGKLVEGQPKYQSTAKTKLAIGIVNPGFQYGTRWSKAAIEFAAQDPWGMIHFHLDGLGNIEEVLKKTGDYSHNVTARELRYVYRNWDRFSESVFFYNGYTLGLEVVQVAPPWTPDLTLEKAEKQ